MHKSFYAAMLIALAGLLGCPRRPVDFGPRGRLTDPQELLRLVDGAEHSASSISAEGQVTFDVPEGKLTVGAFASAAEPASLMIQANDFFGRPQSVLASDGDRFGLWVAQEGAYYVGPATPANLARFLRVPLAPAEVVAMLLGRAPRITPGTPWTLTVDGDERAYLLTAGAEGASQRLWIDPVTARPVKSEIISTTAGGYRVTFSDVQPAGVIPFPRRTTLESLSAKAKIELSASKVTLNEQIDPAQFSPDPPEDVTPIELDATGAARSPTPK
ncbi:MAG TPA: DUF4292 domain-containing protein [Myxococcaceae bacterium]|nr:DUF4292 domain-containing protein [Myxococcaceae bacterium]